MSKEQYRKINFRSESAARIVQMNEIIDEYQGQSLTARQLYYQFVARGLIENTPRSYQNLTSLLTDARYAGLVSWDAIEDRGREPDMPGGWSSIERIVEVAISQFRLHRWDDQDCYVELWVEKQALAGVLAPIASRAHIPLMVNKGYSSASAMKASADRMLSALGAEIEIQCPDCGSFYDDRDDGGKACGSCCSKEGPRAVALRDGCDDFDRQVIVLYLGDHDPSGEDMVRDIRDRLTEFGVPNLEVRKLALTMAQIRRFNPPPNPAKITDSRAAAYIAEHGEHSWELDALPPRELNRLVEAAITGIVDKEKMAAKLAEEERQRDRVRAALIASEAVAKAKAAKIDKASRKPGRAK